MANCSPLPKFRQPPKISHAPWTKQLLEVLNKNLETHLRRLLHDTPDNWSIQNHCFAFAHNSQPSSNLHISPYEEVFHAQPRIPLIFQSNPSGTPFR